MHRFSNFQQILAKDLKLFEQIHKPHFRLTSLFTYLVFLLIFNLFIAPAFGLSGTHVAAGGNIDTSRLVDLANQSRAQNGASQLTVDQRLVNAANAKAVDMLKKQYWSHYGPNGETPWQFIIAAGYNYTYAGENLAKDFTDTDSVHQAWMNSSSHRANILNTNYKNVGIAAISGKQICNGTYPGFSDNTLATCGDTIIVVQMFGTFVDNGKPSPTTPPASSTPAPTVKPTTTSSLKSTNKPVPTSIVPKVPSIPSISTPENNSYIDSSMINISGKSEDGTSVTVYEGDKKIGTVLSEGGAFDVRNITFDEGAHSIKANAKFNDNSNSPESFFSNDVKFTIDTTKPVFQAEKITIQSANNNEFTIDGEFAADTISVKADVAGIITELQRVENTNTFRGFVNIPPGNVGVVLSALDAAGNIYTSDLKLQNNTSNQNSGITLTTDGNKSHLDQKQIVNLIVGILILAVFIIDSFIVWRTGRRITAEDIKRNLKTNHNRGNLLHHTVPVVIVIVAILLTFSGQVL